MADWTYIPGFVYTIRREGPHTLVTTMEDGSEIRRKKTNSIVYHYVERYEVNRATLKEMMAFYESKGLDLSWSRLRRDPLDHLTYGTTEIKVRFERPPTLNQIGPQWYRVTFEIVSLPQEQA